MKKVVYECDLCEYEADAEQDLDVCINCKKEYCQDCFLADDNHYDLKLCCDCDNLSRSEQAKLAGKSEEDVETFLNRNKIMYKTNHNTNEISFTLGKLNITIDAETEEPTISFESMVGLIDLLDLAHKGSLSV